MKNKFLAAFIIACTFVMAMGIINASAGTYGDLTYELSNGEVTITDCNTSTTTVTIPSTIENCPVTSIGNSAFEDCSSLTSITIPDSVTSIGTCAFNNTAYYNNANNWDNGLLYIGNHLIRAEANLLGSYVIKAGTKAIAGEAFCYCTSLTSITIPDSVTSIGSYAFEGCSSLTSIPIPNSVTSIGRYAFRHCSSLTSITIPDSVTSIGDCAFEGCSSLTSITIPDSVTSIGSHLFYKTAYYNNVDNWDNGVLYVGNHLINAEVNLLGSYVIKAGTKTIAGNAFNYCSSLTSITIPDSVTSIGNYAFEGCSSLTSITIPDSVTSIGLFAFSDCSSLTSITIPDSVTSIEYGAFFRCSGLANVYYNGTADMWNSIYIGTFNDALINATRIYEAFVADIEKTDKGYGFDIRLIEGNIDSFETATLTVALYDNNRMLLDYVRVSVSSETDTLTPTVETNKTPDHAKIMLWGGANPFNPLCIAKEIPIQ